MHVHGSAFAALSIVYAVECTGAAPPSFGRAAGDAHRATLASASADPPAPRAAEGGAITPALRAETVERLLRALDERYVFPDKAARARDAVAARLERGDYDAVTTGKAFAATLTRDVNESLRDPHFGVGFVRHAMPEEPSSLASSRDVQPRREHQDSELGRVARLAGNIGYVEVLSLGDAGRSDRGARGDRIHRGDETAAGAAIDRLSDADALVLDLRRTRGGDPDAVAALGSYFFAAPVHLDDIHARTADRARHLWTAAEVPGRRYLDRDVYVLVGGTTGAGAEELAYALRRLKRATLVGETTSGGARLGDVVRLSDHFSAFVPTARAIDPVTGATWERVGVAPDIDASDDDAVRVAQQAARDKRRAARL